MKERSTRGILLPMNEDLSNVLKFSDEVAAAHAAGAPIVALESAFFSHGLPRPINLEVARSVLDIIRSHGVTPAIIAVIEGEIHIGLSDAELVEITTRENMLKSSSRDLAIAIAFGKSAATTISASIHLAAMAGIKIFVTSGLDGTRRNSSDAFDESADFTALSTLDITVVCAGVKSIIDIESSLANLNSFGIDIIGYQTDKFPGYYLTHSDFTVEKQAESAAQISAAINIRKNEKTKSSALIVANPVTNQMDRKLHDSIVSSALALAEQDSITGKALTAHLLEHFHTSSNGESLRLDIEIIKSNASLASEIAKI